MTQRYTVTLTTTIRRRAIVIADTPEEAEQLFWGVPDAAFDFASKQLPPGVETAYSETPTDSLQVRLHKNQAQQSWPRPHG